MKPEYDGMDLYNAICTIKSKKYKVWKVYNNISQKMCYNIESKHGRINGEFLFESNGSSPTSYSIGFPVSDYKPIQEKISIEPENKQQFVEDFISFRLSRL